MNTRPTKPALLILAGMLAAGTSHAKEIDAAECPAEVRKAIEANARGGRIDEIELFRSGTGVTYVAEIDLPNDRDLDIHVSETGTLLKTVEDIRLSEAPEAVRNSVSGLEGTLDDIDKVTEGGTTTYHVEMDRFAQADLDVLISADGAVLSRTEETGD